MKLKLCSNMNFTVDRHSDYRLFGPSISRSVEFAVPNGEPSKIGTRDSEVLPYNPYQMIEIRSYAPTLLS